jgi:phytoene dehydrogenase-like protein
MNSPYDAIIIGAGHNGLTAAFYLARSGLRTVVLERRDVIGGCAVTEEIDARAAPGCRVSTASYMASMLRPEIIRDLELGTHGLRMVASEPGVQAVTPDGMIVPWWTDPARFETVLARFSPRDAASFHDMEQRLRGLARHLEPLFMRAPPDLAAGGVRGLREFLSTAWRLRGVRGRDISELVGFATGSLGEYLDRFLESPQLKSLILANSLYGKHGGPYDPGTLFGLLFHLLGGGNESKQGYMGHVMGGMGAITQAMAAACRTQGVEIRVNAPVASVQVRSGRAESVVLEDGSEIAARVIVSNADPKRTFLKMVPAAELAPEFLASVRGIKMDGPCAKFNLVLDAEPHLVGMDEGAPPLQRCLYTITPWLKDAQRIYDTARRGEIADELWIDVIVPSLIDDSLAPAGRHVMTCFVQYLPYTLAQGDWASARGPLEQRLLAQLSRWVPEVATARVASRLYTPADLEAVLGITEGNIFHGDLRPDQLWFMRPVPDYARYASPLRALYLCGAGTHPGGGVTGAPGFNAARKILQDLKALNL